MHVGGTEDGVRRRQLVSKYLVLVAVELDGDRMWRIRLRNVVNGSGRSSGEFVRDCVEPDSTAQSDGCCGYAGLERAG